MRLRRNIFYEIDTIFYDLYTSTNRSEGANDNASGVAAIMEVARILKDVPTEYSIKFIHFTGEEQGLLGSKNYVTNVVNTTNPKILVLLKLTI